MDRLESIKERLNGYIAAQGYANQRTPILVQHRRELLVKFEENVTDDMNYLVQRLERYESALVKISMNSTFPEEGQGIAQQALGVDNHEAHT